MTDSRRVQPAVPDFEHEEHLSRQRAAERLVDIAYALTAGATLELRATREQERVNVPVTDEVILRRRTTSDGDRVDVEVQLSWSAEVTAGITRNP